MTYTNKKKQKEPYSNIPCYKGPNGIIKSDECPYCVLSGPCDNSNSYYNNMGGSGASGPYDNSKSYNSTGESGPHGNIDDTGKAKPETYSGPYGEEENVEYYETYTGPYYFDNIELIKQYKPHGNRIIFDDDFKEEQKAFSKRDNIKCPLSKKKIKKPIYFNQKYYEKENLINWFLKNKFRMCPVTSKIFDKNNKPLKICLPNKKYLEKLNECGIVIPKKISIKI
jgi:hypothetical protein